jgi:AraC family transcriptional regulator of adaptative response / DNA-3-methyladenine glycosylase II
MQPIADGVVEREGVGGLAGRLGYSTRHAVNRLPA